MARDKSKDDLYINCNEDHELKYVSNLYQAQSIIYNYLKAACTNNSIKNTTHMQLYKIIKTKFGYDIPA